MPEFNCRALTPHGQVVRSRLEDYSRLACIRRLRKNGLTPISVTPAVKVFKNTNNKKNKKARNIKPTANFQNKKKVTKNKKAKGSIWESLNKSIGTEGGKVTYRDIRVFTQNFYLLKKANFNNIHALSTVIETTENPKLKLILQDVLAGVEGGEFMYTTMEYYSNIFPYIYINMIKVGELSGSLEISLKQAVDYLDNYDTLRKRVKKKVKYLNKRILNFRFNNQHCIGVDFFL